MPHEVIACQPCQRTCDKPDCPKVKCITDCYCKEGYYRNSTGYCLTKKQCGGVSRPRRATNETTSQYIQEHKPLFKLVLYLTEEIAALDCRMLNNSLDFCNKTGCSKQITYYSQLKALLPILDATVNICKTQNNPICQANIKNLTIPHELKKYENLPVFKYIINVFLYIDQTNCKQYKVCRNSLQNLEEKLNKRYHELDTCLRKNHTHVVPNKPLLYHLTGTEGGY